MGFFDGIKAEAQRNFIARADEAKDHIIYKYPENNIRLMTQLTVGSDGLAKNYQSRVVDFNPSLEAHLKNMYQRRAPD